MKGAKFLIMSPVNFVDRTARVLSTKLKTACSDSCDVILQLRATVLPVWAWSQGPITTIHFVEDHRIVCLVISMNETLIKDTIRSRFRHTFSIFCITNPSVWPYIPTYHTHTHNTWQARVTDHPTGKIHGRTANVCCNRLHEPKIL